MGPRDLLLIVTEVLGDSDPNYFVTGSMGAMVYGEYRSTLDVDIVADLRAGQIADLFEKFKEPDFYLSREAVREAMEHCTQFNLIHVPSGLKIDFMIPDESPHNASRFARARAVELAPGRFVRVAAPEDVILKKLQYYKEGGSDKHLRDIASMISISGETFDRAYLDRWALSLGVVVEWEVMKGRVGWG